MRPTLFTSTLSCFCSATLILNHFHQLLTCPCLQAKPVSILQAASVCLCILSRSQRWLAWRCKHPYRWMQNDFSHNDFCILFIHYESGPEKSIYTSRRRLFLLLQFVFTKYIHTYLIDKYIMLNNDLRFSWWLMLAAHKWDASQTEREKRAGL